MANTIVHPIDAAIERQQIHAAVCRARRQGLACSTCSDLLERLIRALRRSQAEAA
jgi:hypothetical protein